VPVPPIRPFALRLCRITFSEVIAPWGDAKAAVPEALHAIAPKERKEKIF